MLLPSVFSQSNPPTAPSEAGVEPTHLLIVDDDLEGVGLIIDFLRDYDFAVSTAASGLAGLECARDGLPDLILLDLSMPDADGFEVLTQLKSTALTRDIPVLLLTAKDDAQSKVRGFELGAADYLTKPVAEAELHARVVAQLRQRRLHRALERRLRAFERRFGPLDAETAAEERTEMAKQEVEKLCQARRLLRERLAEPPSLDELARTLGTNQPRLSRGFRALFGTTVFGFLREERLQRARELLTRTPLPVKTVALEVGYRNTGDLSRGIKDRFGMSPSDIRRQP
jgi:DNA-binding response OmpR family regulator